MRKNSVSSSVKWESEQLKEFYGLKPNQQNNVLGGSIQHPVSISCLPIFPFSSLLWELPKWLITGNEWIRQGHPLHELTKHIPTARAEISNTRSRYQRATKWNQRMLPKNTFNCQTSPGQLRNHFTFSEKLPKSIGIYLEGFIKGVNIKWVKLVWKAKEIPWGYNIRREH